MFHYVTLTIVFLIIAISDGNTSTDHQQEKLVVDVYYESLCPYSVRFISKQLVPAYPNLKDFITVNFVPFGKASYVIGEPTKFTCQHGPDECHGNLAQACGLYEIKETIAFEKQQQKAVDLVGCVMNNESPSQAIVKCSEEIGFDKQSIRNIKNCISSDLGSSLLVEYGKKTKAFESPILGVPSVAINGVKNEEVIDEFTHEICRLIIDDKKPPVCELN